MSKRAGAFFRNHLLNIEGPAIDRKVIVIESDDWGSIRIPSRRSFDRLNDKGLQLDSNPYNRFDALETGDDLQALFETLSSFRDYKGNTPIVTANVIVANPDFEKIRWSEFSKYSYEYFTETYKRNPSSESSWKVFQEGINSKYLKPQFHGREHVNALRWLRMLRTLDQQFLDAFDEGVFSIDHEFGRGKRNNLMATLDYDTEEERQFAYDQLRDGINIFERIFKSTSDSFIAPCNVWDLSSEQILAQQGVKFIQGFLGQLIPNPGLDSYITKKLSTGMRSASGQIYLVRNAYFEPSTLPNYDWIGNCLQKIQAAFFWRKPAIVSMHRLNVIGTIFPENRNKNLLMLSQLLKEILKRWPEVEFLSSDQLGHLYANP